MKKITVGILILVMAIGLCACGSGGSSDSSNIDIDLTEMSSTMVYSEVNDMMMTPGDYVGKTVKMRGNYATMTDEATGNVYHACVIRDATACCAQGVEFVPTSDYGPEDYPEVDQEVTVVGVFSTYNEGEQMYVTLKDASMEF